MLRNICIWILTSKEKWFVSLTLIIVFNFDRNIFRSVIRLFNLFAYILLAPWINHYLFWFLCQGWFGTSVFIRFDINLLVNVRFLSLTTVLIFSELSNSQFIILLIGILQIITENDGAQSFRLYNSVCCWVKISHWILRKLIFMGTLIRIIIFKTIFLHFLQFLMCLHLHF